MNYSPEALDALMQEVESQGGALLPDRCEKQDITYEAPPYNAASTQRRATCGCGNETIVVSIYDAGDGKVPSGAGFARVCAVCDDVGAWPRYCDAVYNADPDMRPPDDEEGDDE
jgi:hypothetical protein